MADQIEEMMLIEKKRKRKIRKGKRKQEGKRGKEKEEAGEKKRKDENIMPCRGQNIHANCKETI